MSNKKNKPVMSNDSDCDADPDSGSEKDSDVDSDGNYVGEKELQAEFEGRNPEDCDFHGIKQLLRQLFLKSDVDLAELTQIIISQNYIGSVVKQCIDDGVEEDEDEGDGSDGVFGITTLINITKRKDEPCIKQIRQLLVKLAEEHGDSNSRNFVKKIIEDDSEDVGLLINERILNIPPAITVPLFASLQSEIDKAVKKNMPYNFRYIVWICKTYQNDGSFAQENCIFANQEEQVVSKKAITSFDVDVSSQADLSQWDEDDGSLTPFRKVLILDGRRLNEYIRLLKEEVEG